MIWIRTNQDMGFTVKRQVDLEYDPGISGQLEKRLSKVQKITNENGAPEEVITRA